MAQSPVTEAEFIAAFRRFGSPREVAKFLNVTERRVYERRSYIEKRSGIALATAGERNQRGDSMFVPETNEDLHIPLKDGQIVIGSDAHYWPEEITTAHMGFCEVIGRIKPKIVVLNGDIFDGARISRHLKRGWDLLPDVKQEIEAVQDRCGEIEAVSGNAKLIRTLGNHCLRFEQRLAMMVPEYENVGGMLLKDHIPRWEPCAAVFVNDNTVIKHRYHNGVHARWNNALKSGRSIVTGHLHALGATPFTDYNGTRYGIDTGCLADPWGPQFQYLESNPRNWRAGFVVLTFHDGDLLPPEIAEVLPNNRLFFRGEIIKL